MNDSNNTRWWESYLTRYLVGTIVGAVCLFYLVQSGECNAFICLIRKILCEIKCGSDGSMAVYVLTLAMLGFAHCYLISAPLTLLHHARLLMYDEDDVKKDPNRSQTCLFKIIYTTFWVFCLGICFLIKLNSNCNWTRIALLMLILVALIAAYFFVWKNLGKQELARRAFLVSRALKSNKAEADTGTYKALAEHGNAYSIVILQIVSVFVIQNSSNDQLLAIALLWFGFGALCWFSAKRIEHWYARYIKFAMAAININYQNPEIAVYRNEHYDSVVNRKVSPERERHLLTPLDGLKIIADIEARKITFSDEEGSTDLWVFAARSEVSDIAERIQNSLNRTYACDLAFQQHLIRHYD